MTVFWRYWLLQVPGWAVLGVLLYAANRYLSLSVYVAVTLWFLWLVKDALLYPILRQHYEFREREAHEHMLEAEVVAREPLSPRGYVDLRGELWMAELVRGEEPAPAGARLRIDSVDGLTLRVKRR